MASNGKAPLAAHAADTHDLIRVQGARVNNLKDISVELPKRRLTVFTGVSGSGKSSLVFSTIAAESQRMINETYSAFVQGFMPTLARPEVDLLEGLTTAIIVDQERMGANPRSTVGTATDANAMLRILFSRLGQAAHRSADRVLVQRPDAQGERGDEHREGRPGREERRAQGGLPRRHVPALRGHGRGQRLRPDRAVRREQVAQRGRADGAGLQHGRLVRPDLQRLRPSTWTSRSASSPRRSCDDLLYARADQDQGRGHQPHLRGRDPARSRSRCCPRTSRRCSRTSARFVERAITFTTCPECDGTRLSKEARSSKIKRQEHRRPLRDADQRPRRVGPRPRRAVGGAAAHRAAAPARLVRRDRPGLPLARPARRARCPGERPSAPR